jgi:hypothetical protein
MVAGVSLLMHKLDNLPPGAQLHGLVDKLIDAVANTASFVMAADYFAPELRIEWMQMFKESLEKKPSSSVCAAEQVRALNRRMRYVHHS